MSEAILKGYNSLVTGEGNTDFTIVPPTPHLHSYTKIKRWWNNSYDKVTYTECALISYHDSYIVVSCDVNVLVKIIADNNNQLDFNVIFKNQGDGGIKRILVCPKDELYGLVNYDDYYYDYGDKQIKKVTYGGGGAIDALYLAAGSKPTLDQRFAKDKSLIDKISGNNLITFSRASTGTYVDSDGLIKTAVTDAPRFDHDPVTGESLGLLIEEERTNLITDSTGAGFITTNVTRLIDNTIVNPEGQNGAFKLTSSAVSGIHRINKSFTSANSHVGSVFVKKGTSRYILVGFGGMSNSFSALFDIEPGLTTDRLLGQGGVGIYSNINAGYEEFPNDWIRIWAIGTTTGTNGMFVGFAENNTTFRLTNFIGSTADTFYIWGFQYEDNATFTTSFIKTSGSAVTRSPDIASIEGNKFAKTNLLEYSERFDQWQQHGVVTTTPNAAIAPSGTQTADLVTVAPGGPNRITSSLLLVSGSNFTFSFYFKNVDINEFCARVYKTGADALVNFNATTVQPTSVSSFTTVTVVDALNGWKRVIIRYTNSLNTGVTNVRIGGGINSGAQAGSFYVWGAQLEEGDELTEYTPSVDIICQSCK